MAGTTPEDELRDAWRNQETELTEMKLGALLLQQKARELRQESRRESLGAIATAALIVAGAAYGIAWSDAPLARVAFAMAAVWTLLGQYVLHRAKQQAPLRDGAGLLPGLDACRDEIKRQLGFHRGMIAWLLGPLFAALGAFIGTIARTGPLEKMAPFLALLSCWTIAMIIMRARQERELQRDLEELDQIERGVSA